MNDIGNGDTPAQEQGKVPHDRSSTNHMLAAAAIGLSLAFMIVVAGGYLLGWNWTGLPERTFWDWLKLLIVPAVLALGGYLFTRSENERTRELADRRAEVDQLAADIRARTDRWLAEQRRQDEALQNYLDQMAQLLLDEKRPLHEATRFDGVSRVARARTLTALPRLSRERKASVLRFIYESDLVAYIAPETGLPPMRHVFTLEGADLSHVILQGATLPYVNLAGTNLIEANLRGANLNGATLFKAILFKADLRDASIMNGANLALAYLQEADLRSAMLHSLSDWREGANLKDADLSRAKLQGANLNRVDLRYAKLAGANLRGTNLTEADMSNSERADMSGADMTDANLQSALIAGADLSEAKGLKQEQMEQAVGDSRTKLPKGLSHPEHWDSFVLTSRTKKEQPAEEVATPPWEPLSRLMSKLRGRLNV